MAITLSCPNGHAMKVNDDYRNKSVGECPHCNVSVLIPDFPQSPDDAAVAFLLEERDPKDDLRADVMVVDSYSHDQALAKAHEQVPQGYKLIHIDILSRGGSEVAEGVANTLSEAYHVAEAQVPMGARVTGTEVCLEPNTSRVRVQAPNEQEARKAIGLRPTQIIKSISVESPGTNGFFGLGKKPSVFMCNVFQPGMVRITFNSRMRLRCRICTHEEHLERSQHSDNYYLDILRGTDDVEKAALLRVLSRRDANLEDAIILAIVDLLTVSDDVRYEALKFICTKSMIPTMAWKLAYELRERFVYKDELVLPAAVVIARFETTPSIEKERVERALDFVRKCQCGDKIKEEFNRLFAYHTRHEPLISPEDVKVRRKDKALCVQCGSRMDIAPKGSVVQLRCEACDITRFEKPQDLSDLRGIEPPTRQQMRDLNNSSRIIDRDPVSELLAKIEKDPFHIVGQGGSNEQEAIAKLLELLQSDPALITRPNENGGTLLFRAVEWDRAGIVEFLLAKGADVHAQTMNGNTPWKLAQQQENAEIVALLKNSASGRLQRQSEKETCSMSIQRGGLGEPYCSERCWNAAGKDIAAANLQGYDGLCGFCQRPVRLDLGSGNFAHPFRKMFLYICPRCRSKAESHAAKIQECCFCGGSLTK